MYRATFTSGIARLDPKQQAQKEVFSSHLGGVDWQVELEPSESQEPVTNGAKQKIK